MKTVKEFVDWLTLHKEERFWKAVESLKTTEEQDNAFNFRTSLEDHTHFGLLSCKVCLQAYNTLCSLIDKENADKDIQQSFDDNQ